MTYQVCDYDALPLDAHYDLEDDTIIFLSRGGSKGSANARNTDYATGLKLLLDRLSRSEVSVKDAWLDSSMTQGLPISERRIISSEDLTHGPDSVFKIITARMKKVGRNKDALPTGGNSTRQIRI